ncbi:unnamed protein product [Ascophyllum nodosum]
MYVFLRGGLLMLVSDSPQRAQLLYCKAPNKSTKFPCPTCLVSQTEPDGGELCDPNFPIYNKMRSRKYQDRVQKELAKLQRGSTVAKKLSTKTGVNAKNPETPWSPLTDLITTGESARVAVAEILHLDPLNHLGFVISQVMGIMNKDGRSIVSGVLLDLYLPTWGVYAAGSISHWYGYSALHKWLFGTIMLFVFRPLLMDIKSMEKYSTPAKLSEVRARLDTTRDGTRRALLEMVQASSALSHAIPSPSFCDREIRTLDMLSKDVVSCIWITIVLGRPAAKQTSHALLHLPEMVRDHGVMPNAGVGEAGHQRHKRGNKSGSGREMAKHHMRRVNTELALEALLDGTSWKARKHSRRDCVHKTVRVRLRRRLRRNLEKTRRCVGGRLSSPSEKAGFRKPVSQMVHGSVYR